MQGFFGKASVIIRHIFFRKCIGRFYSTNPLNPKLLNQPVLKCQMDAFNAPFGLASFRAQRGDVKAAHGSGKLGFAGAGGGVLIIDSEYAGFIAIEDHGFTVFLNIATRRFKIGKCGLRFNKQQVHQATGGIVNIDQSSTRPTPVFKPVMVTAINLYQLTSTGSPVTGLMNFWLTLSAGDPQSSFNHQAPDGFLAKDESMNFLQFFTSQRGAKIAVAFPNDIQRQLSQ